MRISRGISIVTAAVLAIGLAACSSDDDSSTPADNTPAATETTTDDTSASSEEDTFPVTVEHAYGTTIIPEKPERVATVAWANHEVALALDIVPVGMSKATWGDDDDNGVLPWVEDKLAALGAETPTLFDETDGVDFQAVNDTDPDVILAAYSGITEEEYTKLSEIAPVVAFPDVAWGTTLEQMIEMDAAALGKSAAGAELIANLKQVTTDTFAKYSSLAGKSILFTWIDPTDTSQIGFYTNHDPRASFPIEYGMVEPQIVTETSANTTEFYATVSAEQADKFSDVDVIVTYGDDTTLAALQADPLLSKIPAIEKGAVVVLTDNTPLAASANPSPLSVEWGIDEYLSLLDKAAQASA